MKRFVTTLLNAGMSRAVPPLVIGFFFLLYLGVAFFTDETLVALLAITSRSTLLSAVLALIPMNSLLRVMREVNTELKRRRSLRGGGTDDPIELFDEGVTFKSASDFSELEGRISAPGYRIRRMDKVLAVCRGFGLFPVRILFFAGTFCLFTGILISTTSRTSQRRMVIERAIFPTPQRNGGIVERISLSPGTGSILSKNLTIEVAPSSGSGYGKRTYGLYPPSLYEGSFVYPRFLGLALHLRFSAPDLSSGFETRHPLNCYPPGKEDSLIIPESPYRIVFTLPEPDAGSDRYISYVTGDVTFRFKLLKGINVLFTGSIPAGGEFSRDGYHVALPEIRRLVVTDFIRDYGVIFIWSSALFFGAALCLWLPVRLFFPRREMLFRSAPDGIHAYSRAEGGSRRHAGVFHEVLDLIDERKTDTADPGQLILSGK